MCFGIFLSAYGLRTGLFFLHTIYRVPLPIVYPSLIPSVYYEADTKTQRDFSRPWLFVSAFLFYAEQGGGRMPGYDLQYNPYLIPRERKRARVQSVSGKAGIRSVSGTGARPKLERKSIYEDALEISPAADISRLWAGSWIRGVWERPPA